MRFDHENLDVYRLALEVAHGLNAHDFPRGTAWLRDQSTRAAGSVFLNVAEGVGRCGDAGRNHFRIALGSAAEVAAALDLMGGQEEAKKRIRRVGAMLRRMGG